MDNIIEVKNLCKNYKDIEAVKDISFHVKRGAFFAFLGVNGAGKSTTINILCTVLEKTKGQVIIGGYDLDQDKKKIKDIIGIVFQGHVLDPILTVKENLCARASYYGLNNNATLSRINELADLLDLHEILNQRYTTLSGGQKRRVDIARALIHKPEILFLDEPTTGLDPQTRVMVWHIINDLRKQDNLTVFLTTHYMEETVECDEVVILDKGKIVAWDTPHELKNKYTSTKLYWYTKRTDDIDEILYNSGYEYTYINDNYQINIINCENASKLLNTYGSIITDYELIKGDMDDVFLKVTGKKLGD